MKGEGKIGKCCVIHMLEMDFTFLNKRNEFIISTLTGCVAKDIRKSIVYTALSINTYKIKSL